MQEIVRFVADKFYWVFLGVLVINLIQRKYQETATKKRFATLYIAIALLLFFGTAQLILTYKLQPALLGLAALAILIVGYIYRDHVWPFRLRCQKSGKWLDAKTFLFRDSNILPEYDSDNSNQGDNGGTA